MSEPGHRTREGAAVAWWLTAGLVFPFVAAAAPGDHIQVGEHTVITPEVSTGVEWRSNSYLSVGPAGSTFRRDQAVSSFNFMLRPRLGIQTQTRNVRFDFDGSYELRKWFDPDLAANLDRFTDFNVNVRLDALTSSVVGFTVRNNAAIRNRDSDNPGLGNSLITQTRNDFAGLLTFRAGPEFSVDAGVGWAWHNFRVPGADAQRNLNTRNAIEPQVALNWRFFPSTAYIFEASYQINQWGQNWIPADDNVDPLNDRITGSFLAKPNSGHFKAVTGLRGRFTDDIVASIVAGWGFARYNTQSVIDEAAAAPGIGNEADPAVSNYGANIRGIDGLLVTLRGSFDLGFEDERTFGQRILLLYRKDFQDSFFTNYVAQNHLRVDLHSRWGRYLNTALAFGPRFEEYEGEVNRRDVFLRADAAFRFTPTRYLELELAGAWTQRASSHKEVEYDNFQARFIAMFRY